MFKCFLANFGYFLEGEFATLDEAIAFGKTKGYEFIVYHNNTPIGSCRGVSLSWYCMHSDYSNYYGGESATPKQKQTA